jgi:hypothetical protein
MRGARRSLLGLIALLALGAPLAAPATAAPASPWTKLGAEVRGSYRWSVKAGADGAAKGPCLLVAASWRSGPLEYHRSAFRECAPTAALSSLGPPLIVSAAQPSTGASVRISAVGMIFAPAARRVRLTLAGGRTETVRLRRFDPAPADRAELPSFRYAAFAIRGTWCAERLVGLSASGAVLWDSGVDGYACGSGGEPHFADGAPANVLRETVAFTRTR